MMNTGAAFRSSILFTLVLIIALLLAINIFLIYQNGLAISQNKKLQDEAERGKVNTLDIIRTLHLLDLGIRGYALVNNPGLLSSIDTAKRNKDPIFKRLEESLVAQNYPSMDEFKAMRDSVDHYFQLVDQMLVLVKEQRIDEFKNILNQDRGYFLWLQYKELAKHVNAFEDEVQEQAKSRYELALRRSYLLQILIFLLAAPLLIYMAYYASRTFRVSEQLRVAEAETNVVLAKANERLDRLVQEKTHDILAQNEEIMTQNEEIRTHNEQLVMQQNEIEKANRIISEQSHFIQSRNSELQGEVLQQTQHLRKANFELMEKNSRLEQFTYIISHNLRAPLARVQGLASILSSSLDEQERKEVIKLVVHSSQELERVITDLSQILNIQKSLTQINSEVVLAQLIRKVISTLDQEITQVEARIRIHVDEQIRMETFAPYLESVFYNLVSNAIKYRDPERPLEVTIEAVPSHVLCVKVKDNGLGIDLARHGDQIFNLYKRFHLHVEGKGLGLYLIKTQVEALGGRIEVTSKVNEGTTFTLYFT